MELLLNCSSNLIKRSNKEDSFTYLEKIWELYSEFLIHNTCNNFVVWQIQNLPMCTVTENVLYKKSKTGKKKEARIVEGTWSSQ